MIEKSHIDNQNTAVNAGLNWNVIQLLDERTASALVLSKRVTNAKSSALSQEFAGPLDTLNSLALDKRLVLIALGLDALKGIGPQTPAFCKLILIETDLGLISQFIAQHELTSLMLAARLQIIYLPISTPILQEISLKEMNSMVHNLLFHSKYELRFLDFTPLSHCPTFFINIHNCAKRILDATSGLIQAKAPKFTVDVNVISPKCIIFNDLAQCFEQLGLSVKVLTVPDRQGEWSVQEIERVRKELAQAPAKLTLSRNRALFESNDAQDVPMLDIHLSGQVANWWWDVPNLATYIDLKSSMGECRSLAFAKDILTLLPQGGEWLPPGARMPFVIAGFESAVKTEDQDISLSFVGQSRTDLIRNCLINITSTFTSLGMPAQPLLTKLLGEQSYQRIFSSLNQHREAFKSLISSSKVAYPALMYYCDYLFEMACSGAFRVGAIELLALSGMPISIYGDPHWLKVNGVKPDHFKGPCESAKLPELYRRSKINLNLNFMQVSSTVNPKVLDICASGAVALTDYRPELELLYPDPSTRPFAFKEMQELPALVERLIKLDLTTYRERINAYTVQHHTMLHRANWIARRFGLITPDKK